MENLPFTEEMEEFIGKSILLRGGRVSDSLSVYLPLPAIVLARSPACLLSLSGHSMRNRPIYTPTLSDSPHTYINYSSFVFIT